MSDTVVQSRWTQEELRETGLDLVVPHIPELACRIKSQVYAALRLHGCVESTTLKLLGIYWDATKLVAGTRDADDFICEQLQCYEVKPSRIKLFHDNGYVHLTAYFSPPLTT